MRHYCDPNQKCTDKHKHKLRPTRPLILLYIFWYVSNLESLTWINSIETYHAAET